MQQLVDILSQHGLPPFSTVGVDADNVPDAMLDHMGIYMHKDMWALGVSLINTNKVSVDDAYEFVRRAVHVVDTSDIVLFLIEASDNAQYNFLNQGMIHYLAPILCAYFSTFPSDTSALNGLLRLSQLRRSPIIIEEVVWTRTSFASN